MIKVKNTKNFGRGIFATKNIKAKTTINISNVLVIKGDEYKNLEHTIIDHYVFAWNDEDCALALGLGSLFNHNDNPNVDYFLNKRALTITYKTVRPIRKGEQLFIDYGYDPMIYKKG